MRLRIFAASYCQPTRLAGFLEYYVVSYTLHSEPVIFAIIAVNIYDVARLNLIRSSPSRGNNVNESSNSSFCVIKK